MPEGQRVDGSTETRFPLRWIAIFDAKTGPNLDRFRRYYRPESAKG
jgi:hypothetical protein